MTEAEWLACTDSDALFDHLTRCAVSPRKKRLLSCGCCRLIWDQLEERSRAAVTVSERYADGLADLPELERAAEMAEAVWREQERREHEFSRGRTIYFPPRTPEEEADVSQWDTLYRTEKLAEAAMWASRTTVGGENAHLLSEEDEWDMTDRCKRVAFFWSSPRSAGSAAYSAHKVRAMGWPTLPLLRDIFGNPFRRPTVDPAWLAWSGRMVINLARAIYDAHRFTDLPVLADALEEAGCDDEAILAHCRGPGPHVRGCWVVDLILGNE
jgi:hypothetical protein